MLDDKLEAYQRQAIQNTLPGFGSWIMKHQLQEKSLLELSYEEMMATLGTWLKMYEREMGKALNPNDSYDDDGSLDSDFLNLESQMAKGPDEIPY